MDAAETRLCLLLHSIAGLEEAALARLLMQCGSPQAVAGLEPERSRELGLPSGVAQKLARVIASGKGDGSVDIEAQTAALAAVDARILPISDMGYPPLLRAIHDPPPLLYYRGDPALLAQAQLAVVGSRKASSAGLRIAADLAGQAARAGLLITSGLAQGIDAAAHAGALAAGKSISVMGTGIDLVYPSRNRSLALEIERAGCVVSEFAPGVPPLRQNFPRRNRVISGMSLGVLVIEATLRSGSLITARTALEQGREVFALPWSISHPGGAGCLNLIRDGAKMVETIRDVFEELGPLYSLQQDLLPGQQSERDLVTALTECQQRILQLVGYESVTADELCRLCALPVARVMAELSFLELQGMVERSAGGYIRC